MTETKERKFKSGSLILGALMVAIGVLFLVVNIVPYFSIEKFWPLFMLIPVAILAATWIQYGKRSAGVILPIIILVFYCGYFLWLNFTSWYHTETTWPNFLIGPGLGFLGLYFVMKKWEYLIPSYLLLILAAVFYGAILENTLLVSILLIAMGLFLILNPIIAKSKREEIQG